MDERLWCQRQTSRQGMSTFPDNRGGCHKNPNNSDVCGASRRGMKAVRWLVRLSGQILCELVGVICVQACLPICCNDLRRADCTGDASGSRSTARSAPSLTENDPPCARAQVLRAHLLLPSFSFHLLSLSPAQVGHSPACVDRPCAWPGTRCLVVPGA